jgi:putrescine transport system substrate-binding protein
MERSEMTKSSPQALRRGRAWRVLGCTLLAFAAGGGSAVRADDAKVLNIYNWSDYIGETTVKDFEKETGIKVRYDTYDTNETLHAKLVAGHSGYDIVVPSSHWAKIQIDGGLLKKLDKSKVATYANIDPWVLKSLTSMDPGNDYLVPWMWGYTTVGINVDKVKAALGGKPLPDNAWDLVFNPEYAGKLKSCGLSLLDSSDEVFSAALRYIGKPPYSKDPADYQAAAKMLAAIRPDVTLFSSSGYINDLAAGTLCVAVGFNGDIAIAGTRAREAKNGQNVQILVPKGGAVLFFDAMAIPADAQHVENAYKWMSFIYRPEVQAGIVNKVLYANPVRAAEKLVRPEVSANKGVFVSKEELERLVPPAPVGNDTRRLRTRLFERFKTGR